MTTLAEDGAPLARRSVSPHLWRRALLGWLAMAVAMPLNGIARETALVPRLGAPAAGVASAVTGIALLQLIAWKTFHHNPTSLRRLAAIAAVWLMMTLGFEFGFGHYVDRKPWTELFENYNLLHGHLWPIVLASLVAAPFLWGNQKEK